MAKVSNAAIFGPIGNKIDIITSQLSECAELIYNAAWNEVIEASANSLRECSIGTWVLPYLEEIRRLKK